jgi:hypothetical protein
MAVSDDSSGDEASSDKGLRPALTEDGVVGRASYKSDALLSAGARAVNSAACEDIGALRAECTSFSAGRGGGGSTSSAVMYDSKPCPEAAGKAEACVGDALTLEVGAGVEAPEAE